ncbi:MAG: hypothetical protein KGO83_04765, partial [Paenibacillaceae bacterium]|nr:hypothetical protein [Paenibacillaceae bacterium]
MKRKKGIALDQRLLTHIQNVEQFVAQFQLKEHKKMDNGLKKSFALAFRYLLHLMRPVLYNQIDWSEGYTTLNTELLVGYLGKPTTSVDFAVAVKLKTGEFAIVHI